MDMDIEIQEAVRKGNRRDIDWTAGVSDQRES
jgi:hypothetical protein